MAIQQGIDAKTVSSILGHYSAGFTLDAYTHVTRRFRMDVVCPSGAAVYTFEFFILPVESEGGFCDGEK